MADMPYEEMMRVLQELAQKVPYWSKAYYGQLFVDRQQDVAAIEQAIKLLEEMHRG